MKDALYPKAFIRGAKDLNAEHYTAIQRIKKRPARRLPRPGGWAGNGRGGGEKRNYPNQAEEPSRRFSPVCETKRTVPGVSRGKTRKLQYPTGRRRRRAPVGGRAKGAAAFGGEKRRSAKNPHRLSELSNFQVFLCII